MKQIFRTFILIGFAMLVAFSASAQDKTKRKNQDKGGKVATDSEAVKPQPKPDANAGQGKQVDVQEVIDAGAPVITGDDTNSINWKDQYIESKGYSVMDKARYPIEGQAELMAYRGAVADCWRNLAAITQGVRVVGETTVKDYITTSDYVYTRIDAFIKNAEMVGDYKVRGNMVEVTMRMPLARQNGKQGLADVIYDANGKSFNVQVDPNKKSAPAADGNVDPSLLPVLVDENGNVVFDYSKYYDPKTGKIPQYIEITTEVADILGAGSDFTNVIDGVQDAVDGTVTVKPGQESKLDKWINIIGKIINVGTKLIGIF